MALDNSDAAGSSTTATFARGFLGNAFNSALVATLFNGVMLAGAALTGGLSLTLPAMYAAAPIGWGLMSAMATSLGIFGGVMAVRRANEEQSALQQVSREIRREAENYVGTNRDLDLDQTPDTLEQEMTGEPAKPKWQNRVTRGASASTRLQAVIDNGRKSKADYVTSIVAEREEAALANPESQR